MCIYVYIYLFRCTSFKYSMSHTAGGLTWKEVAPPLALRPSWPWALHHNIKAHMRLSLECSERFITRHTCMTCKSASCDDMDVHARECSMPAIRP